ncbi:MAG: DivIVA domain-containing protein [Gemmatimonadota bacterium]
MIDLTPLDVRNKRGDFKKHLRGYDPQEVDVFLELAAERLEQLVMENLQLKERSAMLQEQVSSQTGREKAVQEALVTAQELRSEIRSQAEREADLILKEARQEARRLVAEAEARVQSLLRDAERRMEKARDGLEELERRRSRFLKAFRQLLERELDGVEVEEGRAPLDEQPIDLDLTGGWVSEGEAAEDAVDVASLAPEPAPESVPQPAPDRAIAAETLESEAPMALEPQTTLTPEDPEPEASEASAPVDAPVSEPPAPEAPSPAPEAPSPAPGGVEAAAEEVREAMARLEAEEENLFLGLEDGRPEEEKDRWE